MNVPKLKIATLALLIAGFTTAHADLVVYYNFDDSSDLGKNTGSATVNWNDFSNVSQTTGAFGDAGSFTAGSSEAWNQNLGAAGVYLDNFSLSLHLKTSSTAAWKDFSSIGTGVNTVFVFELMGSGQNYGVANYNVGDVGGDNGGQPEFSGYAVNDNQWHHVGLSVSGGIATLYVDGLNVGSKAYSGSGLITAFQLASRFGEGARAITTALDDVAIFNSALSDNDMFFLSKNPADTLGAVPEPASAGLIGLGALAFLLRRKFGKG